MKHFSRIFLLLACALFTPHTSVAKMNLRFEPVNLLVGALNAQLDFEIADGWTAGPRGAAMYVQLGDYKFSAWSVGARANYFLNGKTFTNGWFWGPSVEYGFLRIERNSSVFGNISGEVSGLSTTHIFGYGWYWKTFNMSIGGGPAISMAGKSLELKDSNGVKREEFSNYFAQVGITPRIEFSLGFMF